MRALGVEPILVVFLHMDASCGWPRALLAQWFHRVEWLSMSLRLGGHSNFICLDTSDRNVTPVLWHVVMTSELFELILLMDYF